jgi:hypothetical protein
MTSQFTQQFQEAADKMKQFVPEVKFNKNGYEIRTQMLEMAQSQAWQDYNAKLGAFQTSVSKDGNEVVTKVEMPVVPGIDQVLAAAEKFYAFVNQNTSKK